MRRNMNIGSLVAVAAGGYLLWANRFRIQRFLESNGIDTPWLTGSAGDAISSGAAKLVGNIENVTSGPGSAQSGLS